MGRKSGWWDNTWSPVAGCLAASPGCRNCYAAKLAATQQVARRVPLYENVTKWVRGKPVFNGEVAVLPPAHHGWRWPLTWKGAKDPNLGDGQPSLIFVVDMADLFYQDRPTSHIDQVVGAIAASPHIGLLQTKYAEVMAEYFTLPRVDRMKSWRQKFWLGFSAESQSYFDERWAHMRPLAQAGWLVFVAVAPMLEAVTLPNDFLTFGSRVWCIVSGEQACDEQGRPPRHMDPDWARRLRDQCAEAGVPFFLNQMAHRKPIPADLFVRQFPRVIR